MLGNVVLGVAVPPGMVEANVGEVGATVSPTAVGVNVEEAVPCAPVGAEVAPGMVG